MPLKGSLPVNFNPDQPELAPLQTDLQKQIFELGVQNPAANLYSPTFIENSGQMFQSMFDGLNEIVVGRMELSELDRLLDLVVREAVDPDEGREVRVEAGERGAAVPPDHPGPAPDPPGRTARSAGCRGSPAAGGSASR